jgi:hypothetical protein
MYVTPFVRKDNSAPTWRIFVKWVLFRQYIEKTQISFKYTKNNGTLHEDRFNSLSFLARLFLAWEKFDTQVVEESTQCTFNITVTVRR